ncbi:MAG: hypothetical protein IJ735_02525, partial [Clostridia bacterium]|nr:hypothetical protein [Clostridia bacterium]
MHCSKKADFFIGGRMKKRVAAYVSPDKRDFIATVFSRLQEASKSEIEASFSDSQTLWRDSGADCTLVFSDRMQSGLKDYVRASDLYARVRDITTEENKIVLVDGSFGGIYDGDKGYRQGPFGREAYDEERVSEIEIERVVRVAYEWCERLRLPLCSVDLS